MILRRILEQVTWEVKNMTENCVVDDLRIKNVCSKY